MSKLSKIVEDQMENKVVVPEQPRRIISLVPSQTELLFDLGLDEEIVGITDFCVHPREKCATKPVIGGTKQFNFERIEELQPDLIIGNKEENYQAGIKKLQEKYPVWMSDVTLLEEAYAMMYALGQITGRGEVAAGLIKQVQEGLEEIPTPRHPLRVAYLIWRKPYMVAGHRTFAHEMLVHTGFVNVFGHLVRYPEVTAAQIRAARPDVLFLSSEPFPFTEKYLPEFEERFPNIPAVLVDGQMFTWYGSRLLHVPAYIRQLNKRLQKMGELWPLTTELEDLA